MITLKGKGGGGHPTGDDYCRLLAVSYQFNYGYKENQR